MPKSKEETRDAGAGVSGAELELAQLGQTVIAFRAQCAAVIEGCDAALMVISAMQLREKRRTETMMAQREQTAVTSSGVRIPPTFGGMPKTKEKAQ
jgi:hypothetical protein